MLLYFSEIEKDWQGGFYFIQGADTQYGLIDRYLLKLETPNWDKEIALTEKTVRRVNEMRPRPRFFVVCGDLCDAFPGNFCIDGNYMFTCCSYIDKHLNKSEKT